MEILDTSTDIDTKGIVSWQYSESKNLLSMINMVKGFSNTTVSDMYSKMIPSILNVSEIFLGDQKFSTVQLDVWGGILGFQRPSLPYTDAVSGDVEYRQISDELYRKMLYHRILLTRSNGSIISINNMFNDIFNGSVIVKDNLDMTIRLINVQTDISQEPFNGNAELYSLFNLFDSNAPYSENSKLFMDIFMLPTGVGLEVSNVNPDIFGLNIDEVEGQNLENFVVENGNLDHGGKFGL